MPDPVAYDRMVLCVVQDDDAGEYSNALREAGISHTRVASAGGFLQATNAVFVVALEAERLDELKELTASTCITRTELVTLPWTGEIDLSLPVEVEVGGAAMFVLKLEQAERL